MKNRRGGPSSGSEGFIFLREAGWGRGGTAGPGWKYRGIRGPAIEGLDGASRVWGGGGGGIDREGNEKALFVR